MSNGSVSAWPQKAIPTPIRRPRTLLIEQQGITDASLPAHPHKVWSVAVKGQGGFQIVNIKMSVLKM